MNKDNSHPLPPIDHQAAAAFWQRVHKSDGCWLWTGGKRSTAGYGVFQLYVDTPYGRAKLLAAAHRVAYTLAKGPVPSGAILLHSCDTPACVRPDHLRPGTRRENSQDMISRGRRAIGFRKNSRGGLPGHAKVSSADVEQLRTLYFDAKMTVGSLSKHFGLSKPGIIAILTGRVHRMTPGPVGSIRKTFGPAVYGAKLDEAKVAQLRGRYLAGETIYDLAPVFGIAPQTVSNIIRNKTWKHVAPMPDTQIRKGHHKLSREQVTTIRQRHAAGTSQARLAADYHVSRGAVSLIINRKVHI